MTKHEFIKRVQEITKLPDLQTTEEGVFIVFSLLRHRLTENESEHVASQLPNDLKDLWDNDTHVSKFIHKVINQPKIKYKSPEELYALVEKELDHSGIAIDAKDLTKAVFHVLKEQVSKGEIEDVKAQVPKDLSALIDES